MIIVRCNLAPRGRLKNAKRPFSM